MRQELIMDALNLLDDGILEETDALRRDGRQLTAVSWKWAGIAACLVLMISGVLVFYFNGNEPITSTELPGGEADGLPLLTVMDYSAMGAGYGAELAYDVSELVSGNPWSETDDINALPVFRNPIFIDADDNFKVTGMNVEKMQETLLDMAGRLGQDADSLQITGPSISSDPLVPVAIESARVTAEWEGVKLEVDASLTVQIDFDPPRELPEGYHNSFYASYEEKAALGEYLQEAYSSLIGWETPVYVVTGDYTIYADQHYEVEFYNGEGSLTEKILNYNFYRIVFSSSTDDRRMDRIRIFQPDLSQKLGDYPIITTAEAKELLLAGEYVTSVPYEVPGEEYVASVELVYSTGEMDEYFMPYYRFYVELPEQTNNTALENGWKEYGIYDVPAVEGKYLDDKPLWHFNF